MTKPFTLAALLASTMALRVQSGPALKVEEKTALLMIDVQNCFCEAGVTTSGEPGSLSVADTESLILVLNFLRDKKSCLFDHVVRSQDFHPPNHISFGPTHGLEPFAHLGGKGELPLMCVAPESGLMTDASCCPTMHVDASLVDCETQLCPVTATDEVISSPACSICRDDPTQCFETTQAMWTNHCLQEGDSDFPPTLVRESTDIVVQKGKAQHVDAYSAFADNTKRLKSGLDGILTNLGVRTLYVTGIATDYCVYYSVLDALELGYNVKVIRDATRGIAPETVEAALEDMAAKGAEIITNAEVMGTACPVEEEESFPDASSEIEPGSESAAFATLSTSNYFLQAFVGLLFVASAVVL